MDQKSDPDPASIKLSVVVCTRNRGERPTATLSSILETGTGNIEVILIDQSTDGATCQAVAGFNQDPRFRYIPSQEVGTGRARNHGLREARGDFVLFTDDDCVVAPNWVATMRACFNEHPNVCMVFSNVEPAPYDRSLGFIPDYIRMDDKLVRNLRDKCRARGIGASMAVRREKALSIGGFDNLLGPGTNFPDCEDGDMAVRTLIHGGWIFETCRTHVIHDGFRTWEQGKELGKRNWTGIGAAYAKPLRCGQWHFLIVFLYESMVVAILKPLSRLLRLKKPQGLHSIAYFLKGVYKGSKVPIDCQTGLYRPVDNRE